MQSTVDDVKHYDWLIDIQLNKFPFGWSHVTVMIDLDILEKLHPLERMRDLNGLSGVCMQARVLKLQDNVKFI